MEAVLFFLALVFGLHIAMVNLGITFSTVVPITKRRAELKNDEEMLKVSRELMRFYGATYGIAGVFGTAFTVFLLSFYPGFIGLAGHLTFVPFGIAILAIVIHFLAIVLYWYGWDKFSSSTHYAIGLILLVSVYIIPLGFRAISAFLNIPVGLELQPKLHLNVLAALGNPTLLPLYLKSVAAALTAGTLTISSAYMFRYLKTRDATAIRVVHRFMPYAAFLMVATLILGAIYAGTLYVFANYKFRNAFGIDAAYNYSWLFAIKAILILIQVLAIAVYFTKIRKNDFGMAKLIVFAGPAALVAVFAGEMLNSFSQYPYLVAALADPAFVASIPEPARSTLVSVLDLTRVNPLTTQQSLYIITLAFLGPLLASTALFLYLLLFTGERAEST
ncbi:cytochrome ubiquinol oxidase subunit I [Archaeoglobus veneficus]|uniref:Cytochrome bd-type quinol oxidase, subunit 1 n=1 Tax=Archaeoglobus veneficus (strain DSM 11195 / SNP6) TaxID=693661 RepID=F2KR24_ARCVS|nr:cytochrome ubiquinol oxidase subunit I [Archaeoglobus veneficus]AEA46661.1 cytochrome bd-type quinol oxidase, subunit 1 [Archaeoglobus veneficus SNP6]